MAENAGTSKSKPKNPLNPRHQIKSKGHVLFSYNWSDSQPTALKIGNGLRDEGYPIWIDIEQMQGNIHENLDYAVENAAVVLLFVSPNYEEIQNCSNEISRAYTLKKRIISIYTQKGYTPKGKLGVIAAGKLYFDFSNEELFDDKLKALIKEIGPPSLFLQQDNESNQISRNEDKKSLDQILQEAQEKKRFGEDNSKVLSDEPKANDLSESRPQDTVKDDLESTDVGEDTDKCLEDESITTDLPTSSSQDALTDSVKSAVAGASQEEAMSELRVMISYKWDDTKELATEIHKKLKGYKLKPGLTIKVLRDEEEFRSGEVFENIRRTLNNASIVLIFESPKYYHSLYCNKELHYIMRKKIPRVFLLCYKGESSDIMDLIRGNDLYCDFPGGKFSDESFKKLLSNIENQWNEKFSEGKLRKEKRSSVQKNPGEEAVNHILECQNKCLSSDVKPIKVLKVVNKLPEVYPLLVEALFYEGEAVINDKYRPSSRKVKVCRTVKVNVDDIFSLIKKKRFVALIGPAGCGKTTLSKKLVESKVYKCFHVELRKTGYKEKLTLKQFLLGNQFRSVDSNTIESAFEWIKNQKNQKKCLFILDGLDQAGWANMLKTPECPKRYEESMNVHELIAMLFHGYLLEECHLLLTSRPHTMLTLCEEIRPHLTILVQDLHFLSMKKLFDSYCGDRKEEIWERLEQTAPQLKTLCFNPLMLQFVVGLLLHSSKKVGPISTLTHLFASALKSIEVTSERKKELPTTLKRLSKLSYQGIKDSSVVFTSQQLKDVNLEKVQVQDIMVSAMANNDESFLSQLVDGEEQFFFSHQTFQEYLCAEYIANDMPIFNFEKLIEDDLFKPHWSMVKKFLCGHLYDDNVFSIKRKAIESRTTRQKKLKDKIEQQLNEFKYTWQEADVPSQIDTSSQPDWKHQDSDFEQQDSASEGSSQIKSKESSSIVEADKPDTSTSHHPLHYHHQRLVEFEEVRNTLDDDVLESLAKQRALVDLWASIQECNKDDMTTLAVKLFPPAIDLSYQEWSLNEIVAISSMLERVAKPIEKLSFICCSLDSHSFAYLAKGIKNMKGSIRSLKLIHNKLKRKRKDDKKEEDNARDGLDMICEIIPKVREELDIWNCFTNDDGKYRSFTDKERDELQQALDELDDTTLKIGIGLINDEEIILQHHMTSKKSRWE